MEKLGTCPRENNQETADRYVLLGPKAGLLKVLDLILHQSLSGISKSSVCVGAAALSRSRGPVSVPEHVTEKRRSLIYNVPKVPGESIMSRKASREISSSSQH